MTNERTYQIIIVVLVLIIVGGGWYLTKHPQSTVDQASTSTTTSDTGSTAASSSNTSTSGSTSGNTTSANGEAVSVSNQKAGMSVLVSSVTLGESGWVAVRDASGRTLGAALFQAGTHTGVKVDLLRATTAGQTYQVMLYSDNGDKKFDLHADSLVTNADGSVAGATFTAN
ncbi:MAG TPA: hypothetical protein VN495_00050 [Candidatus Paceibacterota bacterium]|nr:hypothetical protein [Candidatus Paceibacterota bacterium]